jgi:hypothetical protein
MVFVTVGLVIVALIAWAIVTYAGGGDGNEDYIATLFTYENGKLNVNIGNVFLLAMAIGAGISLFRD